MARLLRFRGIRIGRTVSFLSSGLCDLDIFSPFCCLPIDTVHDDPVQWCYATAYFLPFYTVVYEMVGCKLCGGSGEVRLDTGWDAECPACLRERIFRRIRDGMDGCRYASELMEAARRDGDLSPGQMQDVIETLEASCRFMADADCLISEGK